MITPEALGAHLAAMPFGPGTEHIHNLWGRIMIIWCHPHDGACLIIERMETTDPGDDDLVLDRCERSDLSPAEGRQWPYLGFTNPSAAA